jgi:UDP-N-acetylmuramate dehydrogenase
VNGLEEHVPLAPRTTFGLGGTARWFCRATTDDALLEALRWAKARGVEVAFLGGGSNLVVADAGFDGLVVELAQRGRQAAARGGRQHLRAAAGEDWDALVAWAVEEGWAGLECLSGIPGRVGATPIQNVGAYGQDVGQTLTSVAAIDLATLEPREFRNEECAFAYRHSRFKAAPGRFVVTAVTFALPIGGPPMLAYGELERAFEGRTPTLAAVRDTVIALRRRKSMVLDPEDPNGRTAGSFFTNPLVAPEVARRVEAIAIEQGLGAVPSWPAGDRVKLAAGWLIEKAGMTRGTRRGHVGLSSAHALALVHHGGGTTAELVDFAREVRDAVRGRFGVTLVPEPVFLGHRWR